MKNLIGDLGKTRVTSETTRLLFSAFAGEEVSTLQIFVCKQKVGTYYLTIRGDAQGVDVHMLNVLYMQKIE